MSRFYVYRLFDDPLVTLYVGKGSGSRLDHQMRKWNCEGEIIEHCGSEIEAFEREVKLIAELKPTENKHPGGIGGRAVAVPPGYCPIIAAVSREMLRIGPRRYVARALLRFDPIHLLRYLSPSKLDAIRQVANGPRL